MHLLPSCQGAGGTRRWRWRRRRELVPAAEAGRHRLCWELRRRQQLARNIPRQREAPAAGRRFRRQLPRRRTPFQQTLLPRPAQHSDSVE